MTRPEKEHQAAQAQLAWYVRNVARSPEAAFVSRSLANMLGSLTRPGPVSSDEDFFALEFDSEATGRHADADHRSRIKRLKQVLKKVPPAAPRGCENLEANVDALAAILSLQPLDADILRLALRYDRNSDLERLTDQIVRSVRSLSKTIGALLGVDHRVVHARIIPGAPLIQTGVLTLTQTEGDSLFDEGSPLGVAASLRRILHRPYQGPEQLVAALFGEPQVTELAWEDYEHLGQGRDICADLLAGAARTPVPGLNILLHGPVGTGKTELSKLLAMRAGSALFSVGTVDSEGREPRRADRLASLQLAARMLAARPRTALLFDEAEDLMSRGAMISPDGRGSKVFLNRLLEENPLPVIWTCNNVEEIDPAFLRRMSLAIAVGVPSAPVRARIWSQALQDVTMRPDPAEIERLARAVPAPPAVIATAARAAGLAGGGYTTAREVVKSVMGVLDAQSDRARQADAPVGADCFDPSLVNAGAELARITEGLARPGAPQHWSLCISGPSGTGKSAYVRHLAHRIGLEVRQLRASDLLSMWVGESEQRIARAFQDARADGVMLVIDEADSLLRDRRSAHGSWELRQVNELLTWMERHPLPFACTTNLMDQLDPASLRRFTFKLGFGWMHAEQARAAFRQFFSMEPVFPLPQCLTPGDFAVVARRAELLGGIEAIGGAAELAAWLAEEVQAKGDVQRRPIGFATAPERP